MPPSVLSSNFVHNHVKICDHTVVHQNETIQPNLPKISWANAVQTEKMRSPTARQKTLIKPMSAQKPPRLRKKHHETHKTPPKYFFANPQGMCWKLTQNVRKIAERAGNSPKSAGNSTKRAGKFDQTREIGQTCGKLAIRAENLFTERKIRKCTKKRRKTWKFAKTKN